MEIFCCSEVKLKQSSAIATRVPPGRAPVLVVFYRVVASLRTSLLCLVSPAIDGPLYVLFHLVLLFDGASLFCF